MIEIKESVLWQKRENFFGVETECFLFFRRGEIYLSGEEKDGDAVLFKTALPLPTTDPSKAIFFCNLLMDSKTSPRVFSDLIEDYFD